VTGGTFLFHSSRCSLHDVGHLCVFGARRGEVKGRGSKKVGVKVSVYVRVMIPIGETRMSSERC
jgi:hypothetical protein